jgi:hypothetical protein
MNQSEWPQTEATVYSCGWEATPVDGLLSRRFSGIASGHYIVVFSYEVEGNHYSGEFNSSEVWKEGNTFSLHYNPENPEENDQEDERDSPLQTAAVWIGGLALAALYIWWRNRK